LRAYRRYSEERLYVQDEESFILLGRWTHIWNSGAREWYFVDVPTSGAGALRRGGGRIEEIGIGEFCRRVPWGWVRVLCEYFGFRGLLFFLQRRQRRREYRYEQPRIVGGSWELFSEGVRGVDAGFGEMRAEGSAEQGASGGLGDGLEDMRCSFSE
jgi:hypothetical protein